MKYKIALLMLLLFGCSESKPEPEFIRKSDRELELEEKIKKEYTKVNVIRGHHNPGKPEEYDVLNKLQIELWKLRHSH